MTMTMTMTMKAQVVVVGAGSAGSVVASRLAAAGKRVLLLEAGSSGTLSGPLSVFTRMPTALSIPMHLSQFNWGFLAEPETRLKGRRITCPRGKGLGGSSSINGMVYVRGHPMDFEAWEAAGAAGWGWRGVAPFFKRMENWAGPGNDGGLRGLDGPLHVKNGDNALRSPLFDAFIRAGEEAGYGSVEDYNGIRQATKPHWVRGARYLEPALAKFSTLKVQTGAEAARILWSEDVEQAVPRAVGVECKDGRRFLASEEVILSCGAIGSPHLLQVSGVGDEGLLAKLGVPCTAPRPGVGRNLQDHLEFYMQFQCAAGSLQPYLAPWRKLMIGAQWLATGGGLGATNHFEAAAFIRSKAGVQYPDIQYHFLPVAVSYDGQTCPPTTTGHSFQIHVGFNRSKSRGQVTAVSGDIGDAPTIDFNYMSHPEDWEGFRQAVRLAREVVSQPALQALNPLELSPGPECLSDDELDEFLAEHLESAYHPCGTCRMGAQSDPLAVVDSAGAVYGTSGLRVVDSSIFPSITNGNLNAPTIMAAEKISSAILGEPEPEVPEAVSRMPQGWIDPEWRSRQRESARVP